MRIDRRDFYNKIWTTSAKELAKEFGVSNAWLGKLCKKYDVPRPPSRLLGQAEKRQADVPGSAAAHLEHEA